MKGETERLTGLSLADHVNVNQMVIFYLKILSCFVFPPFHMFEEEVHLQCHFSKGLKICCYMIRLSSVLDSRFYNLFYCDHF